MRGECYEKTLTKHYQQEELEEIQKQLDNEKRNHEKERNIQQQVLVKYEKELHQQRKELIEKEKKIGTLTQRLNEATAFLKQSQKDKQEQIEHLLELKSSQHNNYYFNAL